MQDFKTLATQNKVTHNPFIASYTWPYVPFVQDTHPLAVKIHKAMPVTLIYDFLGLYQKL